MKVVSAYERFHEISEAKERPWCNYEIKIILRKLSCMICKRSIMELTTYCYRQLKKTYLECHHVEQ